MIRLLWMVFLASLNVRLRPVKALLIDSKQTDLVPVGGTGILQPKLQAGFMVLL